ncbi:translation initiation factor eIF-2B subunit delta [Trichonephila inaurata madagascariensis]|uniref:Translation initiation factor eIF2B subunit delta n=1 Tax=Trichonephila inaurata madagascariensis TaxID=2747483 RepID=A0A8X7CSH2_9ARAC|nr:translation initiation factor eIF-2B subunit delta [Trichonephila inaurata madagascariensis]
MERKCSWTFLLEFLNYVNQANEIQLNGSENGAISINEILPQKVGVTTVYKDVEVTMTHDGNVNETVNGTSKKKKKKKKSKQAQQTETAQETTVNSEIDTQNNFIKFSEDRIELVNHPEISVSVSKLQDSPQEAPKNSEEKNSVNSQEKEQSEVDTTLSGTSKKKKKKKKKKKTSTDDNNVPTESTPDSTEASYKAPTYVKLPATGDTCVLVVSHESFSSEAKAPISAETATSSKNNTTVLIKNKDRTVESEGFSALSPEIESEPSISIFPVSSDQNKTSLKKADGSTMDSNSHKVSELVGKDINANDTPDLATVKDSPSSIQEPLLLPPTPALEENEQNKIAADKSKSSAVKPTTSETTEPAKNKVLQKPSTEREIYRKSQLFSHLPQYKELSKKQLNDVHQKIHPAIIELGSYYNDGILCGSNARCVGFLAAFREVLRDYKTPPNKEFSRDLESKLKTYLNFLSSCRPLSISITNSVRFLRYQISYIPKGIEEEEAKEKLSAAINNFVKEEILLAKEAICISASAKIVDGDNILVFAYSSLVKDVLCKAFDQNKSFHVIIVGSRPKLEGLEMLRRLVKHGLRCSYTSIDSASYVMKKVSKVIIGAHALLLNGYVMSRLGCKQLALLASYYSVPVLVCCETYKFCDRSLSDSFVHNELGKPDDLVKTSRNENESLKNWQSLPSLQMYNILYDVTPSDLISVIITEKGLLPCTSVPVVLKVKYAGLQDCFN